jgi:hypothetical protein
MAMTPSTMMMLFFRPRQSSFVMDFFRSYDRRDHRLDSVDYAVFTHFEVPGIVSGTRTRYVYG